MNRKAGRPPKPYLTPWNESIIGLTRLGDGRWRIAATETSPEVRFTEESVEKAVARFRAVTGQNAAGEPEPLEMRIAVGARDVRVRGRVVKATGVLAALDWFSHSLSPGQPRAQFVLNSEESSASVGYRLDPNIVMPWIRQHAEGLSPSELAQMLGPRFEGISFVKKAAPLRISEIIDNYKHRGTAGDTAKGRALKVFSELVSHTGAKTLDDLTTERLKAFRDAVEADPNKRKHSYKTWYFGCIKSVIGFAAKNGLDGDQITAALGRCKVLWTETPADEENPTPISREHLHLLLKHATPLWRAMILVGLNFGLHLGEVCMVRWEHLDLDAGTYVAIRNKTRRKRIPRAAVLWPETTAALRALPRTSPDLVFVSPRGSRYNRAGRGDKFAKLRARSGVPKAVTFDWIKDATYTAAVNHPKVKERFARVLCGHRAAGVQDRYVLRNPKCTARACRAVYEAYGPFPPP